MRVNILDRRGFAMTVAGAFFMGYLGPAGPVMALTAASPAKPGDIYVAYKVPVDVTAATVTEARERGLIQGRVAGFRHVVERVVAREDLSRVPQLTANQIIDMTREFSIADERSSAVRYLANLTVRFDPVAIRRMLRNAGIPVIEIISKPVVVISVMGDGLTDESAWSKAWTELLLFGHGLVPFGKGSAEDEAAVKANPAIAKDADALAAIAARNGAEGTVVVSMASSAKGVQITVIQWRAGFEIEENVVTYNAQANQTPEEAIASAVDMAWSVVQDGWKVRNRIAYGSSAQLTALVPVATLKEWTTVKNRLANVPLISRVEIQAITRDRAQVTLYYAGAQNQLELAMAQHDLKITEQGGVWVIQNRDAVTVRAPAAPAAAGAPAQ